MFKIMRKKKISVMGSCASRDLFNSIFVPEYKKFYELVSDQQHVSFISLMSDAIDLDTSKVEGDLTPFYKDNFRQDLDKSYLLKLKANPPELLLIDFYTDVFYGAYQLENKKYITNKLWQYKKINLFSELILKKEFSIYNNYHEFIKLWKKSFDDFMIFMSSYCPETEIIINEAKFLNNGFDESTREKFVVTEKKKDKWKDFHITRFNLLWYLLDTYAIEKYALNSIPFKYDNYYCPAKHQWGIFYLHFNKEYYTDTFKNLRTISKSNKYLR